MTEHQQRVFCALALLDECDIKSFFRAIRNLPDSREEVEVVNTELDRGIAVMDIFGPNGPFVGHMKENLLDLQVVRISDGRWSIAFGFRGPAGFGGHWTMQIPQDGVITELEGGLCWKPKSTSTDNVS